MQEKKEAMAPEAVQAWIAKRWTPSTDAPSNRRILRGCGGKEQAGADQTGQAPEKVGQWRTGI